MKILGYKSGGHDGTICYVENGQMVYSMEAEKGSGNRYALFTEYEFDKIVNDKWRSEPTVICGDSYRFGSDDTGLYSGYSLDEIVWSKCLFNGKELDYASVPHELAHITGVHSMSDLKTGNECYVLLWEGYIGNFYHIDEKFNITKLGDTRHVLDFVGNRYAIPYIAKGLVEIDDHSAAGKIMALAGLEANANIDDSKEKAIAKKVVKAKFEHQNGEIVIDGDPEYLSKSFEYLKDVPLDDPHFVSMCKAFQDEIFDYFFQFAKKHITKKIPLLITGGCGLNCEWSTQWKESNLFSSVFVPPVPNDCGIAIGAVAAVQYLKEGDMNIDWDVYSGEEFNENVENVEKYGFEKHPLDLDLVSELLFDKKMVVAWMQGRYEIGPRALCNRSLIAAPFDEETRDELNRVKQREYFRPVAPVCLEEDVSEHFYWEGPSPYMLYFQKVKDDKLGAITHLDNTARVQTINKEQNRRMHELLSSFKKKTGTGVLCNTSLNFLGKGFINSTSDAIMYVYQRGIKVMVINDYIYIRN